MAESRATRTRRPTRKVDYTYDEDDEVSHQEWTRLISRWTSLQRNDHDTTRLITMMKRMYEESPSSLGSESQRDKPKQRISIQESEMPNPPLPAVAKTELHPPSAFRMEVPRDVQRG